MPGPDARGPAQGWIRATREARGLSLRGLGAKLGIKGNSIHVAEKREASGGISLYHLQRIAAAMDCDLFYAFVPRRSKQRPSDQFAAHLQEIDETGTSHSRRPGREQPSKTP